MSIPDMPKSALDWGSHVAKKRKEAKYSKTPGERRKAANQAKRRAAEYKKEAAINKRQSVLKEQARERMGQKKTGNFLQDEKNFSQGQARIGQWQNDKDGHLKAINDFTKSKKKYHTDKEGNQHSYFEQEDQAAIHDLRQAREKGKKEFLSTGKAWDPSEIFSKYSIGSSANAHQTGTFADRAERDDRSWAKRNPNKGRPGDGSYNPQGGQPSTRADMANSHQSQYFHH